MSAVVSLEALRAKIRELEGGRAPTRREPVGVEALDTLVGGLPRPGLVELHGPPGSGRTRLALAVAASFARRREWVAWADLAHMLHPPAAEAHGVDLSCLLLLRPSADRAVWAVEQVLRSGCFPLVVVADPPGPTGGHGWAHAAEAGHATALVLHERPRRTLPAGVRLALGGGGVVVVRDRQGVPGREVPLPGWPAGSDPWG